MSRNPLVAVSALLCFLVFLSQSLFPRDQVRLAADPRSNRLVVFARTDDLMTIEAILSRVKTEWGY